MKTLLIIPLLVIMFSFDGISQNRPKTYNGVDLELIERVGNILTARYNENIKDYYDFVNSVVNNLDPDINSLNYKAQNYALTNFKNTMQSYVKNENWDEASDDILKAKSQFYTDRQNYIETGKSLQNNSVESANNYYEKANNALKSKNYTLAIYNFDEALKQNPNLDQAYFGRAIAYASLNELEKGLNDVSTFIYYSPDEPKGHLLLARIYSAKKIFDKAIIEYGKTIELNGNEYSFYDERGWIYIEIGKYMEAMKDFNKVISLEPQIVDGFFGRSQVKSELNDNIGEINDLKKVLEINPEHSMANNNLGWSYFMKGNTKNALEYVNKAILYGPDNYVAYDSRGEIKLKLGDYNGTINDSSKAIELNPDLSNSYYIRAQAKYKLGDKAGACEDLSKSGELGNEKAYTLIKTYCK